MMMRWVFCTILFAVGYLARWKVKRLLFLSFPHAPRKPALPRRPRHL
jgi:hypothetical protein